MIKDKRIWFQYILCYGSTLLISVTFFQEHYFNTSYVTVQPENKVLNPSTIKFQYILCYGSTIWKFHFNTLQSTFQYILCYGSTPTIKFPKIKKQDFNTSYVTVQRKSNQRTGGRRKFQYILCYGSTVCISII